MQLFNEDRRIVHCLLTADVSFCQAVLGLGAGAMENRCDLDDTKELAPVPGAGRSIAEASALSIVELARTSSF